jgi:hypothetical protein
MRNVSDKIYGKTQNTRFVFNNLFFSQNRAVYEIMWEDVVERGRPQIAIWRMRFVSWMRTATNTHSQYVIPMAFLLRQRLHEHAWILRFTNVAFSAVLTTVRSTYLSERICSPFAYACSIASSYSMQYRKSPPRGSRAGRVGVLFTSYLKRCVIGYRSPTADSRQSCVASCLSFSAGDACRKTEGRSHQLRNRQT